MSNESYSHIGKPVGEEGIYVGAPGAEVLVASNTGQLSQSGTAITSTAAELNYLHGKTDKMTQILAANDVIVTTGSGSGGNVKAIPISGVALITGGTGIADLTLAAPAPGCRCEIRIDSITSGDVVVTTATGVTFDGSNDIATFNAAADALILGYKSATQWQIIQNEGSVVLSASEA